MSNSADFATPLADSFSTAVYNFIQSKQSEYTHVIAPSSAFTKDYFPRVSSKFGYQAITDVIEVVSDATFKRPVYAGNAIATVKSSAPIKFLTIRPTNFDAVVGEQVDTLEEIASEGLLEGLPQDNRMTLVSEALS